MARAVANSIIKDHLTFVRTDKGGKGKARRRVAFPAFNEAILGGLLLLGAAIVFQTNYERVQEINLFGYVLLVQSLPFVAAVVLAAFESSRANDFALWASLEAKLVDVCRASSCRAAIASPTRRRPPRSGWRRRPELGRAPTPVPAWPCDSPAAHGKGSFPPALQSAPAD